MTRLLLLAVFLLNSVVVFAAPPSQPVPKVGPCPAHFVASGGFCNPAPGARYAVVKRGGCPAGYQPSGAYCLAVRSARTAVGKAGACPAGWRASGNYCLGD